MIHNFIKIFIALLFTFILLSCGGGGGGDKKNEDPPNDPSPTPKTVTVVGTVTGSGGITGVMVSAGDKSTATDNAGNYKLNEVPLPASKRLVLTFEKDGYATYQRSVMVEAGKTFAVAAKMTAYHFSESINPTQAQSLEVPNPMNPSGPSLAKLELPANAVQAFGNVTVNVAVGDPTTENGRAIFPGDYMASPDSNSEPDTELESVAFAEITIKDGGSELETLNIPADLSIKLPDEFQIGGVKAGTYDPNDPDKDFIEWWSYNESNGSWIREDADPSTPQVDDAAVIDVGGVLYAKAKVTHFSWWNVDRPVTEHSCLCVTVVDENGNPVQGAMVIAEGATYNGRSIPVMTDANGKACVNVKRSTTTQQERVKLYVEQGGAKFLYVVTDVAEGDVELNEIATPTTQGSTSTNSGDCVNLVNKIALVYAGTVTGKVTRQGSGAALGGFTLYTDFGTSATTDNDGIYSFKVPVGTNVSVFAPGLASKTVFIPDTDPVTVDFTIENRLPIIESITRNPAGIVPTNATVDISVVASDPDSTNPVAISWIASTGSLSTTTGNTVLWTAPSTMGTAQITVTATDSLGGTTLEQTIILVGSPPQPSSMFKVTVKDNPISNQPVQGATVVFYNTDNRTIASNGVITTGADGVADFGDVGRTTGTLSILYEADLDGDAISENYIDSYIEVPMREIVFYIDELGIHDDNCQNSDNTTINVNFTNVPVSASFITLDPGFYTEINLTGSTTVEICPGEIQSDGTISLLAGTAVVNQDLSSATYLNYGFLLDQPLVSNANYTIDVNRAFVPYGFSTNPATPVDPTIVGIRKNVAYFIGGPTSNVFTNAGNLFLTSDFPVDKYIMYVETQRGAGNLVYKEISKVKSTLAKTEVFTLHDTNISSISYDNATENVAWSVSGLSAVDYIEVYLSNSTYSVEWSIYMANNKVNWQVMQLPPVASGIDTDNLANTFCRLEISTTDYDTMEGHAQVWYTFVKDGFNFLSAFNQEKYAENSIDINTCSAVAALTTSDVKTTPKRDAKPKRSRAINGLLRQ